MAAKKSVPIPPYPFVAGIDPDLKEWLHVRRIARETKVAEGKDGELKNITYAKAIRYKYREWWINKTLTQEDINEYFSFEELKGLLLATSAVGGDKVAHAIIHSRGLKFLDYAFNEGFNMNHIYRDSGKLLLHDAVECGDEEKVDFLLSHGAWVNARDNRGQTALHLSIRPVTPFNSLEIAVSLLHSGANVLALDENGRSPLHWACLLKNREYVNLFLAAHADITLEDSNGCLPYDYAARSESFRKWYDQRCLKVCSGEKYTIVRAKLLARKFVDNVFK
eukprot:scaffold2799_cov159-Ochromonas_danica.AAC.21